MHNRVISLFLTASALISLSACKDISVDPTGAVPSAVASNLVSYKGAYQGTLYVRSSQSLNQIVQNNFTVRFDVAGDRPVVTTDTDILGKGCGSSIGKLLNVTTGGAWQAIATFEFNPGACSKLAQGRTAVFYVRNERAFLTIKKDSLPSGSTPSEGPNERDYRVDLSKK